jgi:Mrp family chromosome partitioning ATPase
LAFCAHLDAFLLVCERETTPLDLLASAAATLQTAGGELLGVIVNKVRPGFSFEDSRGL